MTGDALDRAPAHATRELVPVELEVLLVARAGAPQERGSDPPFGDRAGPLTLDRHEEHPRKLFFDRGIVPFQVSHRAEGERADEGGLEGTAARVDRQGLQLDAELGEIRAGARASRAAERALDELADETLVPLEVRRCHLTAARRQLPELHSGERPSAGEELGLVAGRQQLARHALPIARRRGTYPDLGLRRALGYRSPVRNLGPTLALATLVVACASERKDGAESRVAAPVRAVPVASAGPSLPAPEARPATAEARVYAKARFVWIYPEPDANLEWIGYLRTAGSAPLKSTTKHYGRGCTGPFYELVPSGFVCLDGKRATLDPVDAEASLLAPYTARTDSPWPYRYGESLGLVRYRDLPSPEIQARNESDIQLQFARIERARRGKVADALLGVDLDLPVLGAPPLPLLARTIHEPRAEVPRRSSVAFTSEARHGDRGFLLASDFSWIAKDRVKPYPRSDFHGVELGPDQHLPLAFFRERARPQYRRADDGRLQATEETFPRLGHVALTGEVLEEDGERFLVTWQPGLFVKESDAVVPAPGAPPPGSDPTSRWIEVSIRGGWLLAMEGTVPVYATLMSAGRGGGPVDGRPTVDTASTPYGSFTIGTKQVTATMDTSTEVVHSDVPWVQNFTGPYSLHSATWHDDWGDPASGGCVNLSPIDARWVFDFSEPKLPEGWHAVRRIAGEASTVVVLHP